MAEAITRHRAYYLALVQQDPADWQRIEAVYGQVKRAWHFLAEDACVLDFVHALATYQERRGLWQEREGWVKRALQVTQRSGQPKATGALLSSLGAVYRLQGRWAEALAHYQAAERTCQQLGDRQGMANALEGQGLVYDLQGKWQEASAVYRLSLAIYQQLQDRSGEGKLLANLGVLSGRQSRWPEAIQLFNAYLAICRELGDRHGEGIACNNLGLVYAGQGRNDEALALWQAALHLYRLAGDRLGESYALNNLGDLYAEQEQWEQATAMYERSLAIKREIGDRAGESENLQGIGELLLRQERWQEASQLFAQALRLRQEVGDRYGEARTLSSLGQAYRRQGCTAAALEAFVASLTIFRQLSSHAEADELVRELERVDQGAGNKREVAVGSGASEVPPTKILCSNCAIPAPQLQSHSGLIAHGREVDLKTTRYDKTSSKGEQIMMKRIFVALLTLMLGFTTMVPSAFADDLRYSPTDPNRAIWDLAPYAVCFYASVAGGADVVEAGDDCWEKWAPIRVNPFKKMLIVKEIERRAKSTTNDLRYSPIDPSRAIWDLAPYAVCFYASVAGGADVVEAGDDCWKKWAPIRVDPRQKTLIVKEIERRAN